MAISEPTQLRVLILNGPNLNLLGTREPETYGRVTLGEISDRLDGVAETLGVRLTHVQSNVEGELVDWIQRAAGEGTAGAVVNAAAYTHTSVALRDALVGTGLPFVEVHLSNVYAREPFRHTSLLADVAIGLIAGLGPLSYELGLRALVETLNGDSG
jgi:3-dehydroquinate dehydratase-2